MGDSILSRPPYKTMFSLCCKQVVSLYQPNTPVNQTSVDVICHFLTSAVYRNHTASRVMDFQNLAPIDLAWWIDGFMSTVITVITVILNTISIVVFTSSSLRSPTNTILTMISALDMLTCILRAPLLVYVYIFEGYRVLPSVAWCKEYNYLHNFIPSALHSTAILLNMGLSVQRFVGVSDVRRLRPICSYKGTAVIAVTSFLLSALIHSLYPVTYQVTSVMALSKQMLASRKLREIETCKVTARHVDEFESLSTSYAWARIAALQLLPGIVMCVCNISLISISYRTYTYRRRLIGAIGTIMHVNPGFINEESDKRHSRDSYEERVRRTDNKTSNDNDGDIYKVSFSLTERPGRENEDGCKNIDTDDAPSGSAEFEGTILPASLYGTGLLDRTDEVRDVGREDNHFENSYLAVLPTLNCNAGKVGKELRNDTLNTDENYELRAQTSLSVKCKFDSLTVNNNNLLNRYENIANLAEDNETQILSKSEGMLGFYSKRDSTKHELDAHETYQLNSVKLKEHNVDEISGSKNVEVTSNDLAASVDKYDNCVSQLACDVNKGYVDVSVQEKFISVTLDGENHPQCERHSVNNDVNSLEYAYQDNGLHSMMTSLNSTLGNATEIELPLKRFLSSDKNSNEDYLTHQSDMNMQQHDHNSESVLQHTQEGNVTSKRNTTKKACKLSTLTSPDSKDEAMTYETVTENTVTAIAMEKSSPRRRHHDSSIAELRPTIMLVLVTSCTLLAELMATVALFINYMNQVVQKDFVNEDTLITFIMVSNLITLLSFPLNFIFFCGLSRPFRSTLVEYFHFAFKRVCRKQD